jgi:uncharacterized membrane protein YphA (DoxX/SURF4 family)/HAMP domain-containing protein
MLELKAAPKQVVGQAASFADEVTRVAREVGTEGRLGGQAEVRGVSGTWRDLTENVNVMASNLTDQVRSIATVATAVARGDLTRKITVEAKGEVGRLAGTINTMVDQLSTFAAEVTRVAQEVGGEGKLGVQAQVEGVSGVWKGLTDNVIWNPAYPRPAVGSQVWIGGVIEIVGGLAITIGLFTRCAAFVCSGMMAVAYWQFHVFASQVQGIGRFIPGINQGIPAALLCFVYLYIACKGAGPWSLDAKKEMPATAT